DGAGKPPLLRRLGDHRAGLLERSLRFLDSSACEGEIGRAPERARKSPPVAGPPEDVAGLGELPLRAWEVPRNRLDEAETRQHQPDAAPVVQTPAQLQRAFETG